METLSLISEEWFLHEPAMYSLFCLQKRQENVRMDCAFRVGEGRLEYNPLILAHKNYKETEQLLRIEMIRLFLKHPYERRPEGCNGEVIALGSDCTIADGYCLLKEAGLLKGPGFYHLPIGQCYEWYCKAISRENDKNRDNNQDNDPNEQDSSSHDTSHSALSELWQEDRVQKSLINDLIERTQDWGSLPGDVVETIKASTQARLNSSMVFQGFKSNLISAERRLTRMRPNRRTGFLQMGSRREIRARLLIAVDCSASIEEDTLSRFFSVINRLFRDDQFEIEIMQFDTQILQISSMNRISHNIEVHGRGGTDFQPVIDTYLASHQSYDGLIMLTDGEANPPVLPLHHLPILWVCSSESAYNLHHGWMTHTARACWI